MSYYDDMNEGEVFTPPQAQAEASSSGLLIATKSGTEVPQGNPGGELITDASGTIKQFESDDANIDSSAPAPNEQNPENLEAAVEATPQENIDEIWKTVGVDQNVDQEQLKAIKQRYEQKSPEQIKRMLERAKFKQQERAGRVADHFKIEEAAVAEVGPEAEVGDSVFQDEEAPQPDQETQDVPEQLTQQDTEIALLTAQFSTVELQAIADLLDETETEFDAQTGTVEGEQPSATLEERKMQVIQNAAIDKSIRNLGNQHEFFRDLQNVSAEDNKYRAATEDWLRSLVPENPSSISDHMQPLMQIQAESEFLNKINETADVTTAFSKEDLFMIAVINLKDRAEKQKGVSEAPEAAAQPDEDIGGQVDEVIEDLENDAEADDTEDENSDVDQVAKLEEKRKTFIDRLKNDAAFLAAVTAHLIDQGIYTSDAGRFFDALIGGNARGMLGETSMGMDMFEVKEGNQPIEYSDFQGAIKGTNAENLAKSIDDVYRKNPDFRSKLALSPELDQILTESAENGEYAKQNIARIMDVLVIKMFAMDDTSSDDAKILRVGFQEEVAGKLFDKDKVSLDANCMKKLYEQSQIMTPSDRWRDFDWETKPSSQSNGSSTPDGQTEPMQAAA